MRPNFDTTKAQLTLISKIADRAHVLEHGAGARYRGQEQLTWMMDLSAVMNSCPIDLAALLAADDVNFAHDVFGIRRHIDRETGELADCFVPRFVVRNS
jgi:hypothetical protein